MIALWKEYPLWLKDDRAARYSSFFGATAR